jgi:hypothetical protein
MLLIYRFAYLIIKIKEFVRKYQKFIPTDLALSEIEASEALIIYRTLVSSHRTFRSNGTVQWNQAQSNYRKRGTPGNIIQAIFCEGQLERIGRSSHQVGPTH